jgi:transaldolase
MKVAATWEGLQACRVLKAEKFRTLATMVFSMEQVMLAGEVGVVSISPFLHEAKNNLDES